MADFLRALGWAEDAESDPAHRLFQRTNGLVVALYAARDYERDFGPRTDGCHSPRRPDLVLEPGYTAPRPVCGVV